MATTEKPSRRFDSFGIRPRSAAGPQAQPSLPTASSAPDSDMQQIAKGLRDLGYSNEKITLILAGPSATSIEGLMGRMIPARAVPLVRSADGSIGYDSALSGPSDTKPETPDNGPPPGTDARKFPAKVAVDDYIFDLDQADIIDAVWRNLHGDTSKLVLIAQNFEMLSGPLQAYVSAAVTAGKSFLIDLNMWVAEFNKAQAKAQKERGEAEKQRRQIVGTVAGAAAAAANSIPVVGQLISLVIAAGVAISEAVLDAFPLPLREGADQVHDEYEGLDAFWGLTLEFSDSDVLPARQERYLAAKQAVIQDPVATLLPIPRERSRYKYTPSLSQFRRAAHELGLYEGEPNSIISAGEDKP